MPYANLRLHLATPMKFTQGTDFSEVSKMITSGTKHGKVIFSFHIRHRFPDRMPKGPFTEGE